MEKCSKKNKIAILTEYYNSQNYGGNLQAYALTKILNERYGIAEQIPYIKSKPTYNKSSKDSLLTKLKEKGIKHFLRYTVKSLLYKLCCSTLAKNEINQLENRKLSIDKFNKKIPHNNNIYNDETIKDTTNFYDVFITGSDQVWRNIKDKSYWLDFVPENKIKLSYAASISRNVLTVEEKKVFENSLPKFTDISVREENAVNLLSEFNCIKPKWVLDPTLLLSKEDWDKIASNRLIKEKYLFCYFLGFSKSHRKLAEKYAKEHNLKLVVIPYLRGRFDLCDMFIAKNKKYGTRLIDVSPEEFISLIKYAECVMTDSFHATVFSGIYKKDFFVLERKEKVSMGSRIYSLMHLYETQDRYCDTKDKQSIEYLNSVNSIDYSKDLDKLNILKKESFNFLDKNLI